MGLISELICKHSCQGQALPENIVFIAACNPYRKKEKKLSINEQKFGLDIDQAHKQQKSLNIKEIEDIKKSKKNNLVYSVNPLPHSLLNFVFDFGNLSAQDEKDYIKYIIKDIINKIYYQKQIKKNMKEKKDEDENLKNLKKLAEEMITEAQNYIREFTDKSSVSLREIRRFNIFYEFFNKYIDMKKEMINEIKINEEDKEFYSKLDDYSIQTYSIILSIFVCYYLKIVDKEKRNELNEKMNVLLKKFNNSFKDKDFIDIPIREEKFLVDNIKLDNGIAKNRALLENVFSLFVAINNKVPIFIVGKPGCSKSLSVQLLLKSMQGELSDNPFFRKFPKIMVYTYQGSLSSTSKGVENIFKKAHNAYQKIKEDKTNQKIISMLFFDEMGLAEHSPNNPLKVIHSELEYDLNEGEKQIAFVGISNWVLDAAKMNRGISISIPEPDEEDNKETSLTIGNSFDQALALKYKAYYENLGIAYYEYKKYLKEKHNLDGKEDFHGNRDFYHLVKIFSKCLKKSLDGSNQEEINEDIILKESSLSSIERNFAGMQFENKDKTSLKVFKDIYSKIYSDFKSQNDYNVLERIKENLNDLSSRYLLLILKSSTNIFLLTTILSDLKKEYVFYIGSSFEEDLNSEEYALKVLNKLQIYLENGIILILINFESAYSMMYDLFNQNFTVISNKNYARLAVGSNTSTYAYVNNEFRCIVNVDINEIYNEEPPFLNRFEKHIISIEYLLNKELIIESENIMSFLNEMISNEKDKNKGINYSLKHLLINFNKDEIQAMIYQANKS